MGHRASVAYIWSPETLQSIMHDRRLAQFDPDERVITEHYSHWGAYNAELIDQISEQHPLGSESMEPPFMGALLQSLETELDDDVEVMGHATEPQEPTPVDASPRVILKDVDEWVDFIDPIFMECVYLVDTTDDWNVRAFAPVYWREATDIIREHGGDSADVPMVLVEAGRDAHDVWGGVGQNEISRQVDEAVHDIELGTMDAFIEYVKGRFGEQIWKTRYRMPAGVPEP